MRRLLLLGLGLIATPISAQGGHEWRTYHNDRYGYTICYPADLMSAQPEADNGDGRAFLNGLGASLRVYGLNNALNDTIAQAAASDAKTLRGQITYRAVTSKFFVLSGRNGEEIFYEKTFLSDGQFKTFVFTYPASDARTYNPITAHIAGCFR